MVPNFRDSSFGGKVVEYSYAYFCPRCGEVWGKLAHEGAGYWQCCYRNCRLHGDGRLAQPFDDEFATKIDRSWPREALLREFLIEMGISER